MCAACRCCCCCSHSSCCCCCCICCCRSYSCWRPRSCCSCSNISSRACSCESVRESLSPGTTTAPEASMRAASYAGSGAGSAPKLSDDEAFGSRRPAVSGVRTLPSRRAMPAKESCCCGVVAFASRRAMPAIESGLSAAGEKTEEPMLRSRKSRRSIAACSWSARSRSSCSIIPRTTILLPQRPAPLFLCVDRAKPRLVGCGRNARTIQLPRVTGSSARQLTQPPPLCEERSAAVSVS